MQVCTLLQTDNHASTPLISFLQAGCLSCRPTNSVKTLKAIKLLTQIRPNCTNTKNEMVVFAGDMNGHVGSSNAGYEGTHGGFG